MEDAMMSWVGTTILNQVLTQSLSLTAREVCLGRYRLYSAVSQHNFASRALGLCHRICKNVNVVNSCFEVLLRGLHRLPTADSEPGTMVTGDEIEVSAMAEQLRFHTHSLAALASEARSLTSPFTDPIEMGVRLLAIRIQHDDMESLLAFALPVLLRILGISASVNECPFFMMGSPLSIPRDLDGEHYDDFLASCRRIQQHLPSSIMLGEAVALGALQINDAMLKVISLARGLMRTYANVNCFRATCARFRNHFYPEFDPVFLPMVFCSSVRRSQMRLLRVVYVRAGAPFHSSLPCIFPEVPWAHAYGTLFRLDICTNMHLTRYPACWRLAQVELLLQSGGFVCPQDRICDFHPGDVFHLYFSHECLDNVELGCPTGSLRDLNLAINFPHPVVDDAFLRCNAPLGSLASA